MFFVIRKSARKTCFVLIVEKNKRKTRLIKRPKRYFIRTNLPIKQREARKHPRITLQITQKIIPMKKNTPKVPALRVKPVRRRMTVQTRIQNQPSGKYTICIKRIKIHSINSKASLFMNSKTSIEDQNLKKHII